ncbi:polyphenol oxidase family protein [Rouxiella silvae]|uniref:Polyphenol oxidase family protein n=1 Tax=Rouxiella silvae TaxID=1646373 RepID=A0AA40X0U7_9GAMM|nr:polyphenol oxidase family protein [Rouxiella silvae]MBF6636505.1 polyphenol oxidase family protein [Rouxiella silvae]
MSDFSALLSQVPRIQHGFGSKEALLPLSLKPYSESLPTKKQVHGLNIVDVTAPRQPCGEADGFYTELPGILLTVFTADCLPIIFSRKDGGAVGAVHAGWRGLRHGIIEQMVERINRQGSTADWVASIGPAAGACCYEVSQELVDEFQQSLSLSPALISPSYRHLDLGAIAHAKLIQAGFSAVDFSGSCTICTPKAAETVSERAQASPFKYTSFRRNSLQRAVDPSLPGISGRNQQSGIVILPD